MIALMLPVIGQCGPNDLMKFIQCFLVNSWIWSRSQYWTIQLPPVKSISYS